MLVLTRRIGEQIVIDDEITVTVVAVRGDKVRLGISAPPSVRVDRWEIHERRLASRLAVRRASLTNLEGVAHMRIAQQGDRVLVHYVKRVRDGRTATSREPLPLTVGVNHPRLPGLGSALVGLTAGQATTFSVPPELAYGLSDPKRIRRWSRQRFPKKTTLKAGKLICFTDERGRRRRIRILQVDNSVVVIDSNHPWAGQTLDLEVKLLGFLEQPLDLEASTAVANAQGPRRSRVVAFDVDAASLASLHDAMPEWEIESVNGATPASLSGHWDPGAADLLVVGTRNNASATLGLCRLLSFCTSYSPEARSEAMEALAPEQSPQRTAVCNAPLLVLVPAGQETLVGAALEAGARGCLMLPICAKELTSFLVRARAGNQPGRHTLDLDQAQIEDPWQEDGGEA